MRYHNFCKRLISLSLIGILLMGIVESSLPVYADSSEVAADNSGDAVSFELPTEVNLEDIKSEIYDENQKQTGKIQDIAGDEISEVSLIEQMSSIVKQDFKTTVEVFNTNFITKLIRLHRLLQHAILLT